jgi:hypothetical protein
MQPSQETLRRFLKALKIELPYDTAILLSKANEISILRRHLTLKFIEKVFTIVEKWKQPKYPLSDPWIKMIHKHNGLLLSQKKG